MTRINVLLMKNEEFDKLISERADKVYKEAIDNSWNKKDVEEFIRGDKQLENLYFVDRLCSKDITDDMTAKGFQRALKLKESRSFDLNDYKRNAYNKVTTALFAAYLFLSIDNETAEQAYEKANKEMQKVHDEYMDRQQDLPEEFITEPFIHDLMGLYLEVFDRINDWLDKK